MASIAKGSLEPRYCRSVAFSDEDYRALYRLRRERDELRCDQRFSPDEVPKHAFIYRGSPKTIPNFVSVSAYPAMCPEARALIEEFEPGVHHFFPVEIARKRSKKPIRRLDGRVLDTPYYLFFPQKWLDAVWVERSDVMMSPTYLGPQLVLPRFGSDNIVLRREVVAGHHVWRGRFHMLGRTFFSDALVNAVQARKLRGLEFTRLEEA